MTMRLYIIFIPEFPLFGLVLVGSSKKISRSSFNRTGKFGLAFIFCGLRLKTRVFVAGNKDRVHINALSASEVGMTGFGQALLSCLSTTRNTVSRYPSGYGF